MSDRRKHTFHALWYHFGPYGPQDVHVHPCSADGHGPNDDGPHAGCDRVLIGPGRNCCGSSAGHDRASLDRPESVARAATHVNVDTSESGES